jgi:restriction system protein
MSMQNKSGKFIERFKGILGWTSKFVIFTLGIALGGVTLAATGSDAGTNSAISILGMLLFLLSPLVSFIILRYQRTKLSKEKANLLEASERDKSNFLRRKFLERQRLIDSVDRHRSALTRNIQRSIRKNDYGVIVEDKHQEALEEFFASIDLDGEVIFPNEAVEIVFEQLDIREEEEKEAGFDLDNIPFDGYAFEKWVADSLISFGWSAEVTSASGDQGIDVIAEYKGKKLGLQCKLYSSSIGNKAVQEAHAGKLYYGADVVGVISNATYTSSARDLAAVTGVHLLSHRDIPNLHEKIFEIRT